MKSILCYTVQATVLFFCGLYSLPLLAQQRSTSDILKIAKSIHSRQRGEMSLKLVSSTISPNLESGKGKEAFYIFSSSDNKGGFVIVSGDERMPAILAYSDNNSFDVDSIPPSVRYWLDCYTEAFLSLGNTAESQEQTFATAANHVEPLLKENLWGQGDPYNRMCPSLKNERCVTGCVATAMAQVMKFYQYPAKGIGNANYTTRTNNIFLKKDLSIEYRWEDMLDDYTVSYTPQQADAVADLMYSCGLSVEMDYCTSSQGGSGAYQSDLITAYVKNFGYDKDAAFITRDNCSLMDWNTLLTHELDQGRPVNYAGHSYRDGGHSFVIDGYRMSEGNKYPDYHINWGWNGSCNGYYQIADLQPSEDGQYATMGGFNESQQMTIGIKPEDGIGDNRLFMCTSNLRLSSNTANTSNTIQVSTTSCTNLSYKPFNGTLHVMLISTENDTTVCGEVKIKQLEYLKSKNNIIINATIPSILSDGKYIVKLCLRPANTNQYYPVFSKEYPQLTISNNGAVIPDVSNLANLGCSDMEITTEENNESLICLNLYEILNLEDKPFTGYVRMILADSDGQMLHVFGDSVQIEEIATREVLTSPIVLRGNLTGNWPDGYYRLYAGARCFSAQDYTYISFYDYIMLGDEPKEFYLEARISDGKFIVKGKTYSIIPTSIRHSHAVDFNKTDKIYSIMGQQQKPARKGIYIIKKDDGTYKKTILK